jgi:hypothetical protein
MARYGAYFVQRALLLTPLCILLEDFEDSGFDFCDGGCHLMSSVEALLE